MLLSCLAIVAHVNSTAFLLSSCYIFASTLSLLFTIATIINNIHNLQSHAKYINPALLALLFQPILSETPPCEAACHIWKEGTSDRPHATSSLTTRSRPDRFVTPSSSHQMDTITHLTNKIMAERAHQPVVHQAIDTAPPPPYTESNSDTDDDSDDDDEEEPMKLVINANHTVHGSNNLVPTSSSILADATKFSTILLSAVTQLNNAVAAANAQTGQPHCLRVDLTINCGIAVVGDRNVIGNIGLKPKAPTLRPNGITPSTADDTAMGAESAVVGAKRKANDNNDDQDVRSPARSLSTREKHS